MHRSRLSTILIDCAEDGFERSMDFWSAALGRDPVEPIERGGRYAPLRGRIGGDGGPIVLLQRVPAEERGVHLDIEADDVEAEVSRLERLGARVKRRHDPWVVMEAPSGHAFCVVPARRGDFEGHAAEWSD
jgi:predicted enzyme related to lactoylglutathione lyase